MKIKELIQYLEEQNQKNQLADMEIAIIDPNGYQYQIRDVSIDVDCQSVVININEGSCE